MSMRVLRRLDRRGISVVELIVGVVLLAVVVVSLAASGLYASRTLTRARVELESSEFQQAELERLLAVPYASLASGTRSTPKGTATWTVTSLSRYKQIKLVTNYTPTQGISLWDSVFVYRLNQ
jgi:Tfp pilus assembly protein PilV